MAGSPRVIDHVKVRSRRRDGITAVTWISHQNDECRGRISPPSFSLTLGVGVGVCYDANARLAAGFSVQPCRVGRRETV